MMQHIAPMVRSLVVISIFGATLAVPSGVASPTTAYCRQHTDTLPWNAGGTSADETTPFGSLRNVSLPAPDFESVR